MTDNINHPALQWLTRDDGWFRRVECPVCGNLQLAGRDHCDLCGTQLEEV